MKKILIVLASQDFQDHEYQIPRNFWEKMGAEIKTASSDKISKGKFGSIVKNDFFISNNIDVETFNGIFWVGGGGCLEYLNNRNAENLTWEFVKNNKIIGAICAAPRLLLQWGMLKGRKCTGWNGDHTLKNLTDKAGALFDEKNVIIDGKFITADGVESAEIFAETYWSVMNQ